MPNELAMSQNKITILSTRPIDAQLIEEAKRFHIETDVLSFIDTLAIRTIEVQQEIENALLQTATVIFTSINAVEAVADIMQDQQPSWKIYCLGNTTQKLVKKYFGETALSGSANSAAQIADLIVENGTIDEVIFFCGDQRRDELPDILGKNGIVVNEIVVYETLAIPHKLNKQYQAILFFSPSAAASFFSKNKIKESVVLFAIGPTTATTIKQYCNNKIILADKPDKATLVRKVIEYFGAE